MAALEEYTHVFIVRIWREPREIEGAAPEWRGAVEHVASGERRYIKQLNEIEPVIAHYLGESTPAPDKSGRLRRWLTKWKTT